MMPRARRSDAGKRALIFAALLSCACGGGGDPSGPGEETGVTSVVISPSTTTLVSIGDTEDLSATAKDASGRTISANITWTSSNSAAVAVSANGRVTAVANGTSTIQATASGVSATATVIVAQAVSTLEVAQGDQQVGGVGQPLDTTIVILVRDAGGAAAADVPLQFTASNGGAVNTSVVTTSAAGEAEVEWTMDTLPGPNELAIRRQGNDSVLVLLTATAFAEQPASMTLLDGDNQSELPGRALREPIRVALVDRYNNPVPGIPVEFSVLHSGDLIDPAEAITDLDGIASATWTLGPDLGARAARAIVRDSVLPDLTSLPGSPVTFSAAGVDVSVANVSPLIATVGSTITVNGTGFGAGLADNVVRIDGEPAAVVDASPTALVVRVPSFACSAAQPRTLSVERHAQSASAIIQVVPSSTLDLAVGERLMLDDPAAFCLQFASASTGARSYLVGLTATRAINASAAFVFSGDSPASQNVSRSPGTTGTRSVTSTPGTRAAAVRSSSSPEATLRNWERSFVATRLSASSRARSRATAGATAGSIALSGSSNITVGTKASFRVPDLTSDPCNAFDTQPATIVHVSDQLVVAVPEIPDALVPVVINHPQLVLVLSVLETQMSTVRERAAAFLGELPSAFDADGRLLVLLTSALSDKPVPPAFGVAADLAAQSICAASDEQAIVYVMIDNVDYTQLQVDIASVTATIGQVLPHVVHEFTHILQHGNRLSAGLGTMLPPWLAEGQAELLTEVVGRSLRGDGVGMNYGAGVVNADALSAAWYQPRFERLSYLFGWDGAGGRVAGAPEQCSLFGFGGLSSACRPESAPGAAWSFARFLTDRLAQSVAGGEAGLHRLMTTLPDTASINAFLSAQTGASTAELIVEWAMMLYADGRLAAHAAPALQLPSWNLQNIFASMSAAQRLAPDTFAFEAFTRSGVIVGGGTAYLLVNAGDGHSALAVRVRDAFDRALSAEPEFRMWVLRVQ